MNIYSFFETLATASISTLGAFIPVFLLMCIHYRIRKNSYQKIKSQLLKAVEAQELITKISKDALKNIYTSVGTEDLEGLMNRSDLDKTRYVKLISLANEHLGHIIEGTEKSTQIMLDISYIEDYSFTLYLGAILDKRFPDKRFK